MTRHAVPRADLLAKILVLLSEAHNWWPMPGAAVCVVNRHGEVITVCSGSSGLGSMEVVSAGTRFEIGSISKSFNCLVLQQLADEGLVDISAPVASYLPWFRVQTEHLPITLRHLMQHTSGLIAGSDALADAFPQAVTLADTVTGSAPGEFFHYSNAGYILLGLVIEQVTGQRLADAVQQRILHPLGMGDSNASISSGTHHLMAAGTQPLHHDLPVLPGDPLLPAPWVEADGADGNVVSTATDMGRYARMLLGRGEIDGVRIISEGRFHEITHDVAPPDSLTPLPGRYGLGLIVEEDHGHTRLTHSGGMVGYSSHLAADLTSQLAVVVLTNANGGSGPAELLCRNILDIVTQGPDDKRCALDRTQVRDAGRYEGTWTDGAFSIEVSREQSDGRLTLTSAGESGALYDSTQGRLACSHPQWRQFHHRLEEWDGEARWTYGDRCLTRTGRPGSTNGSKTGNPMVGHYRCYSPWYPSFRIVEQDGRLRLIAATGVEAPSDNPVLVEVEPDTFRIGLDPRLPERLVAGPKIDGVTAWVERDGFRYSRFFRP